VEDHEFQRRTLVSLLSRLGPKRCMHRKTGVPRCKWCKTRPPIDIVISDLEMPGMDGMEFIRHLGQANTKVSLILASALERKLIASIGTMTEAYGIKLLGIAEKPLTVDKLRRWSSCTTGRGPQRHTHARRAGVHARPDRRGHRQRRIRALLPAKIELAGQRVRGAEALARWRHTSQGIVAPFAFISLLEEHGRIDELTWLMLRKSAAHCSRWRPRAST